MAPCPDPELKPFWRAYWKTGGLFTVRENRSRYTFHNLISALLPLPDCDWVISKFILNVSKKM